MAEETIEELEAYFTNIQIPETVVVNRGITWNNVPQHVKQYITLIKQRGLGLYTTRPSYERLVQLKAILSQK
jgi:hypothetical protein